MKQTYALAGFPENMIKDLVDLFTFHTVNKQ